MIDVSFLQKSCSFFRMSWSASRSRSDDFEMVRKKLFLPQCNWDPRWSLEMFVWKVGSTMMRHKQLKLELPPDATYSRVLIVIAPYWNHLNQPQKTRPSRHLFLDLCCASLHFTMHWDHWSTRWLETNQNKIISCLWLEPLIGSSSSWSTGSDSFTKHSACPIGKDPLLSYPHTQPQM